MNRRTRWVLSLLACLGVTGCHSGRAFIASPDDYAEYRRVRLGRTVDERVAAALAYLRARPDGRYAERLRAYVEAAEPLLFRVRSRSVAGLEAYVAALPDGPHSTEALEDLVRLRTAQRREDLSARATRATLLEIQAEGRARRAATVEIERWVRGLVDPATWREDFSHASPDLLAAFRLVGAEPRCEVDAGSRRCIKGVRRGFRVRDQGGASERALAFDVSIDLDEDYRLVRATLAGEHLALRTREASTGEGIEASDARSTEAWHSLVQGLSAGLFADARPCSGGEGADGGLRFECDEPLIVLRASRDPVGRETIVLERRAASR